MNDNATKKNTVTLRKKQLKDGSFSYYLDIYVNGCRKYEFLRLYEVKVRKPEDRIQNQNMRRAAEAIKDQRSLEIANGMTHPDNQSEKILLQDWINHYVETNKDNLSSSYLTQVVTCAVNHLMIYAGEKVCLTDIDKNFCIGFIKYLSKVEYSSHSVKKILSKTTARQYLSVFRTLLNSAVRENLMPVNPLNKLSQEDKKPILSPMPTRAYLTIEEIKILAKTPCKHEICKQTFMFSCFTGLRISDIITLTWSDLHKDNGRYVINKQMVKTKKMIYLPLSKEALRWIPDRGETKPTAPVFNIPISKPTFNKYIKSWIKAAGINKYVTFHVSRHTFATSLLTMGADIYTTSKLLGHQNIKTTQIYAEIIDSKKAATVDLLDGLSQVNPST